MNIKDDYQSSSAFMNKMSRDEIQELRQYLDKNLTKQFICTSLPSTASLVPFVKKPD